MGNTCASVHIAYRGEVDLAAKAITRSYGKLGYERLKRRPAEGGKHVVLLSRPGQPWVSVYDSDNARLDSGELRDLALVASRALRAAAIFTSLYDSDTYEFVVFFNGRQVDLLMTDAESYEGPMKQLSAKARPAKWNSIFARQFTAEQIATAAAPESAVADTTIAALSGLVGLRDGQPQMNYQDFLDGDEEGSVSLYFRKKPGKQTADAAADAPPGEIKLADYFDSDESYFRSVYPASHPMPTGRGCGARWLMLSQGAGFSGGTAEIRVTGPDTLILSKAILAGCKFHNGQIVGKLETSPKFATEAEALAYAETQKCNIVPVESSSAQPRVFRGEFPTLVIPAMTAGRSTQILLMLGLDIRAEAAGEWQIEIDLYPGTQTGMRHSLPAIRAAALEQAWLPVISGLNPKTKYDKSGLSAAHRHDLDYVQSKVPLRRGLDHPAVASSVAILNDEGQPTLDACRGWLEAWLGPLAARQEGEIRVLAEKQMTEAGNVSKTKKTLPVQDFLADKVWPKLFESAGNFQSVLVNFYLKGGDHPVAGIGLQQSLETDPRLRRESYARQMGKTLTLMRGRPVEIAAPGDTWHVFKWVINYEDCLNCLETSPATMQQQLDNFAAERPPLQAWNGQCTWIPVFDTAGSYDRTPYEQDSLLNWFRGIIDGYGLNSDKMSAPWCGNVLRMVTPHMILCKNLIGQVDRAALERVAQVTESGGVFTIALRHGFELDELEVALLPILPVESARISLV